MGRYPVDVTTMLVGLHVALLFSQQFSVALFGAVPILAILQFDARQSGLAAKSGAFHLRVVHFPTASGLFGLL